MTLDTVAVARRTRGKRGSRGSKSLSASDILALESPSVAPALDKYLHATALSIEAEETRLGELPPHLRRERRSVHHREQSGYATLNSHHESRGGGVAEIAMLSPEERLEVAKDSLACTMMEHGLQRCEWSDGLVVERKHYDPTRKEIVSGTAKVFRKA